MGGQEPTPEALFTTPRSKDPFDPPCLWGAPTRVPPAMRGQQPTFTLPTDSFWGKSLLPSAQSVGSVSPPAFTWGGALALLLGDHEVTVTSMAPSVPYMLFGGTSPQISGGDPKSPLILHVRGTDPCPAQTVRGQQTPVLPPQPHRHVLREFFFLLSIPSVKGGPPHLLQLGEH